MKNNFPFLFMRLKHFYRSNIFLLVLALFMLTLVLEIFYRTTKLDGKYIVKHLYYEGSGFDETYVPADNRSIYRLRADIDTEILEHKDKDDPTPPEKIHVITNNAGFRNLDDITPQTDKYRIVILGGSNAFGFCVDNKGTYSALMQKIFDEKYPGKIEVLNAGVPAYVMTQKTAAAETIIAKYRPDMILLQTYNTGRRAFSTTNMPAPSLFYENKELFAENIPLLFFKNTFSKNIHYRLVKTSAFYRILFARLNEIFIAQNSFFYSKNMLETFIKEANDYGEKNNKKALDKFVAKYGQTTRIILFNPTKPNKKDELLQKDGYFRLKFANYGLPEIYRSVHPKENIYRWYSEKLVSLLDSMIKKDISA